MWFAVFQSDTWWDVLTKINASFLGTATQSQPEAKRAPHCQSEKGMIDK